MHVVERGSGTPLVMLHGFGVDHRILLPLDPIIDAAGEWRRLYIDLPGHGLSPAEDVSSSEEVVAVVESELRTRLGSEPFALIGNSFGGMLARRIAHDFRHQVLGLALIAPVTVAPPDLRTVPEHVVLSHDAALLEDLGDAADDYADMAVLQTRENADAFLTYAAPGMALTDTRALARISENYPLEQEPEQASPAPFTQPTLFLTGRQDHVVGYQDAWKQTEHYPRATFVVLDAAGHNLHLDQPLLAGAHITDWLSRIDAS